MGGIGMEWMGWSEGGVEEGDGGGKRGVFGWSLCYFMVDVRGGRVHTGGGGCCCCCCDGMALRYRYGRTIEGTNTFRAET